MNIRDQLTSVQNQLAEEKSKVVDRNAELIVQLEERQNQLLVQISEQEAVQQERIQVQEEKVESIVLPYDFNEVFADPRANEMIKELIKDLQRQAYAEHNDEVELLITEHKAELAEVKGKNVELEQALDKCRQLNESLNRENTSALNLISDLREEVSDLGSKRDAAVAKAEGLEVLLNEKQAHIDKLREEIAIGAKAAINVMNISPSDRLAALVQESKSAKIKSALEIALERTEPIRGKVDVVAPQKALEEATFPTQAGNPANIGLDNESAGQLSTANTEVGFPEVPIAKAPEVPDITSTSAMAEGSPSNIGQGQVTREELENRIRQVKEEIKAEIVSQYGLVKLAS